VARFEQFCDGFAHQAKDGLPEELKASYALSSEQEAGKKVLDNRL